MLTFIDTNKLPRVKAGNGNDGSVNRALCDAKNVRLPLRWLQTGATIRGRSLSTSTS